MIYGHFLAKGEVLFDVTACHDTNSVQFYQGPPPPRLMIESASCDGVNCTIRWQALRTPHVSALLRLASEGEMPQHRKFPEQASLFRS